MRQRGFTLIEVMVVMTIIALLAMKGLPALGSYLSNSKLRESANMVVTTALFARNEAIKRNQSVSMVSDGTTLSVTQTTGTTTTTLMSTPLPSPAQTTEFTAVFDSAGRLSPFGTEIKTQVTGGTVVSCGDDIRCPGVLLESGGAVSLCREGACS
jgi:prepilin-type N-terminal cleavage/methylation domain-containing protein